MAKTSKAKGNESVRNAAGHVQQPVPVMREPRCALCVYAQVRSENISPEFDVWCLLTPERHPKSGDDVCGQGRWVRKDLNMPAPPSHCTYMEARAILDA